MFEKYLMDDSIPWLLDEKEPSIRYVSMREIFGEESVSEHDYSQIFKDPSIVNILSFEKSGILGSTDYFDVMYKGCMWFFSEAVERGLDIRTETIYNTATYIIDNYQMESGGFTIKWKPLKPLACRTGDMLKYLQMAGYTGPSIEIGIQWILNNQRHDGGWLYCPLKNNCDLISLTFFNRSGNHSMRESDPQTSSCFYATIACLNALLLYKDLNDRTLNAIQNASCFFLNHRMFKTSQNTVIKPRFHWNKDFRLLGYPVLMQYDILYGLIAMARAGFANDPRTGEAFNLVMSKQNHEGTWNLENAANGMLHGGTKNAPIGKKDKWVTLNAYRLLKHISKT